MLIKIKSIELKYENESSEPAGAKVDYSLVLNDSQLEGIIKIENKDIDGVITNWQLWQYNKYIHQKIMASM